MLVLTREVTQSIIIGANFIKIKVLGITGKEVKFGIEAPKSISVHREEIYEKIKKNPEEDGHKISGTITVEKDDG